MDLIERLRSNYINGYPLLDGATVWRGSSTPEDPGSYPEDFRFASLDPGVAYYYGKGLDHGRSSGVIAEYPIDRSEMRFFPEYGLERQRAGEMIGVVVEEVERHLTPFIAAYVSADNDKDRLAAKGRVQEEVRRMFYETNLSPGAKPVSMRLIKAEVGGFPKAEQVNALTQPAEMCKQEVIALLHINSQCPIRVRSHKEQSLLNMMRCAQIKRIVADINEIDEAVAVVRAAEPSRDQVALAQIIEALPQLESRSSHAKRFQDIRKELLRLSDAKVGSLGNEKAISSRVLEVFNLHGVRADSLMSVAIAMRRSVEFLDKPMAAAALPPSAGLNPSARSKWALGEDGTSFVKKALQL